MKAASSVPVCLFENAEHLEAPDYVLYREPDPSEVTVVRSLVVGERMVLAHLLRRPGQGVLVVNALIPDVSEEFGFGMNGDLRLLR